MNKDIISFLLNTVQVDDFLNHCSAEEFEEFIIKHFKFIEFKVLTTNKVVPLDQIDL